MKSTYERKNGNKIHVIKIIFDATFYFPWMEVIKYLNYKSRKHLYFGVHLFH